MAGALIRGKEPSSAILYATATIFAEDANISSSDTYPVFEANRSEQAAALRRIQKPLSYGNIVLEYSFDPSYKLSHLEGTTTKTKPPPAVVHPIQVSLISIECDIRKLHIVYEVSFRGLTT